MNHEVANRTQSIVTVVTACLISGLIFGSAGYFLGQRNWAEQQPSPTTNSLVSQEASTLKTYTNTALGFTFQYPGDWKVTVADPKESTTNYMIVSFQSPQTRDDASPLPGYNHDLVMYWYPDINNPSALGGSWEGQRVYQNLADFLTDTHSTTEKIGTISVGNQPAYEVLFGGYGSNYGVMIEHNGIYKLSFETAWDKSSLGTSANQVLKTFQFTK